jgi:hypothetical protein
MKIKLFAIGLVLSNVLFAQDTLVLKGNDFKMGDNKVAELKKKKKGLLGTPKFILENSAEKDLILIEPKLTDSDGPEKIPSGWYVVNRLEPQDSFLISREELDSYEKVKLFGSPTEALAKTIYDNKLLKADGTIDDAAFAAVKLKHPNMYGVINASNLAKNAACAAAIKVLTKRDVTKPIELVEIARTFTEEKKYAEIAYELKQDGIVIGKIFARGNLNGAKKEDSEYDYSPGILDLDFKSAPLDYQFLNTGNCMVASYNSLEVTLTTKKDALATKRGAVVKGGPAYNDRLSFIKTICEFLVKKGYY